MSSASHFLRFASELTAQDQETVIALIELAHPGLTRTATRNVVDAICETARRVTRRSDQIKEEEIPGQVGVVRMPGSSPIETQSVTRISRSVG